MKIWVWIVIALIIVLPIAYYLVSPLWRVVEVQEASPLDVVIEDKMDEMTVEEKQQFEDATEQANRESVVMDDEMPEGPQLLSQGVFMPRAHEVMGNALLIENNGQKVLRFEDFDTVNGPNLHIWLSSSLGEDDYVDLGPIKATKGNVNYEVPAGVDIDRYDKVLVWCVPFGVLFSYAELG